MRVLESAFAKEFISLAAEGYRNNWHERNGGNLSVRLTAVEVDNVKKELRPAHDWEPCGLSVPGLAGERFLITGTGRYFRDVAAAPAQNTGIIELDAAGERFIVCQVAERSVPRSLAVIAGWERLLAPR